VALAARVAGMEPVGAAAAVAEAVAERLLDELPAVEPAVAFPHALIREALLAELHGTASARVHLAIAEALEQEAEPEPTEVARHRALAVAITGPEPAVRAHRHAASVAAVKHDHEQAAVQLRGALALVAAEDRATRSAILLELGDQELFAARLPRAREAFRAAVDSARAGGDVDTLARAALGFAGGDIGFGWELPGDDPLTVVLLREAIAAIGVSAPRLGLQMISRLCFALAYSEADAELASLVAHANELSHRLATAEGEVLAGLARMTAVFARSPERLGWIERSDGFLELVGAAERCGRDELLLRVLLWVAFAHYVHARVPECDATIARIDEVGHRLSSPRFTWEVDIAHGFRALDRGDRVRAEQLIRRGGAIVRRLRPDIQLCVEGLALVITAWVYDADTTTFGATMDGLVVAYPEWGWMESVATMAAALRGDRDATRARLTRVLDGDLAELRRPDGHIPWGLCWLALAATTVGDRSAAARLRSLLEPLRGLLPMNFPALVFGHPPEWHIGRLELLLGDPDAAVAELRVGAARAEQLNPGLLGAWTQVDLAVALHRRGRAGDRDEAQAILTEAEARAQRAGMKWVIAQAATARAELDGRPAPTPPRTPERSRPVRALAARTSRRALAAFIGEQDNEMLERRFAQPRRQRALLRGMVRGFQPAYAAGFQGVVAYEIETFAIAPPPDAPWRWAIEIDARKGRARLVEPAPLDAAVTIYFGLADWLRVAAGLTTPLMAMAAGRCSIEGDVLVAARLESMFGGV
jgi:SCP-2 sterol transfer family